MKRLVCLILSLLFLTGCANVIPSEYATVKPHVESSGKTAQEDAVVVSNYPQLKNAILRFVQERRTEGYIRVNTYDGDVESDLAEAAYEVARVDPLGVYAVDYMTHECTRIVSYYDIRINITFRRTAAEIAAIESVGTQVLLQRRLQQAVEDGERRVTLRMSSYRDQDIAAMVAEYCAANPTAVMEVLSGFWRSHLLIHSRRRPCGKNSRRCRKVFAVRLPIFATVRRTAERRNCCIPI